MSYVRIHLIKIRVWEWELTERCSCFHCERTSYAILGRSETKRVCDKKSDGWKNTFSADVTFYHWCLKKNLKQLWNRQFKRILLAMTFHVSSGSEENFATHPDDPQPPFLKVFQNDT